MAIDKNAEPGVVSIACGPAKVIDGLWEYAISPYKSTEKNAGAAVRESPLLNTVGQVASSVYGGPAGAAAYAAWSTYNLTGDPKLALRAGVIIGGTSYVMQGVAKMPVSTDSEIVRKAAVAGAIGGLAVAAAHGTSKDIKDGSLKSAAMILIQVGYQKFTDTPLDAEKLTATRGGYCMMSSGADCSPPDYVLVKDDSGKVLYGDPTQFHPGDQVANYVVLQVDKDTTSGFKYWVSEQSPVMSAVGRVPPWNAMALAHDKLVIEYNLSAPASVATIPPAVVITYAGTGASVYSSIQSAVVNSANAHPADSKPAAGPATSNSYTVAVCTDPKNVDPKQPNVITKITVDSSNSKTSQLICEVTEETHGGLTHPWHSSHDTNDCIRRAIDLTAQLTRSGLACLTPQT